MTPPQEVTIRIPRDILELMHELVQRELWESHVVEKRRNKASLSYVLDQLGEGA